MAYSLNELNNRLPKLIVIMKKHELLKYAYDNYPKGTVARFGCKPPDHVSTGRFVITDLNKNGDIQIMSETGIECFFADGDWAEIVKPLLISEDGVPLYEGDKYWSINNLYGRWLLSNNGKRDKKEYVLCLNCSDITHPENHKPFHSKEKALEWIEAQKTKSIKVELFTLEVNAICTSDKVIIEDVYGDFSVVISKEKLADINKAMEELQNA